MLLRSSLESITPYKPGVLKPGAIKVASNENPLGPSPLAMEALRQAIPDVYLYPDGACTILREKIAQNHQVDPDRIICGNGSDELLVLSAGAYIEEGLNAITSKTTFSEYTFSALLFGGEMRYAPLKDGRFDLQAILDLVDENTRTAYLCNPNNPTGTYYTQEELVNFMKQVPEHVLVVVDEAYSEYVQADDFPSSIELAKSYENLLILRTFSKIYGLAGLRVGYGIGSTKVISDMLKAKEPFNVNLLAQKAAAAALDDTGFVQLSRDNNEKGKEYLCKQLDAMDIFYYRSQANFICMNLETEASEVFQKMMDLGITIRPLNSYGLTTWIRVTIGTQEQNEFFIKVLKQVLGK